MTRQERMDTLERENSQLQRDLEHLIGVADNARKALRDRLRVMREAVAQDVKQASKELASDSRAVAGQAVSDTSAAAKDAVVRGARTAADKVDPRHVAERQPVLGVALALGAGFAVGMALRRAV